MLHSQTFHQLQRPKQNKGLKLDTHRKKKSLSKDWPKRVIREELQPRDRSCCIDVAILVHGWGQFGAERSWQRRLLADEPAIGQHCPQQSAATCRSGMGHGQHGHLKVSKVLHHYGACLLQRHLHAQVHTLTYTAHTHTHTYTYISSCLPASLLLCYRVQSPTRGLH